MHTVPTGRLLSAHELAAADRTQLVEVPVDPSRLAEVLDDLAQNEPGPDLEVATTVNYRTTTVPYYGGTRTVRVISSRRPITGPTVEGA